MNRQNKIIRNIIILILLFFLFLRSTGLYLTPLSAHRASEKSSHYGPSKVVHVEEFYGGKYILAKYDKWYSFHTINRSLFLFWKIGNQSLGIENKKTQTLYLMNGMDEGDYKFSGTINDENINKIEILLKNGEVLTSVEFYDNMFITTSTTSDTDFSEIKKITGYDVKNNIIYEEEY